MDGAIPTVQQPLPSADATSSFPSEDLCRKRSVPSLAMQNHDDRLSDAQNLSAGFTHAALGPVKTIARFTEFSRRARCAASSVVSNTARNRASGADGRRKGDIAARSSEASSGAGRSSWGSGLLGRIIGASR